MSCSSKLIKPKEWGKAWEPMRLTVSQSVSRTGNTLDLWLASERGGQSYRTELLTCESEAISCYRIWSKPWTPLQKNTHPPLQTQSWDPCALATKEQTTDSGIWGSLPRLSHLFCAFTKYLNYLGLCWLKERTDQYICFKGEEIYIVQEMVPNIKGDNFYCHTWLREDEVCLITKGREVGEMGRCWSKGRKLYLT